MLSALAFIGLFGVCGLMLWLAYRIEPHWVSKDGQRLICYGQGLGSHGEPEGRFRELRAARVNDTLLEVRQKGRSGRPPERTNPMGISFTRKSRRQGSFWNVVAVSPDPPPRKAVYLLGGNHDEGQPRLLALRLPANSRAIPMLEELLANCPQPGAH